MNRMIAALALMGALGFITGILAERSSHLDWATIASAFQTSPTGEVRTVTYRAVLAAGDASIQNFDTAVMTLSGRLQRSGIVAKVLTSDPKKIAEWRGWATANRIDILFNQMAPKPGEGCLVFVTSHGSIRGLSMAADEEEYNTLTPKRLAGILTRHCNDVPTVAILSGCHSGTFLTPQMEAENRIILTAARYDRTSFGCRADFIYTYFDECLLDALKTPGTWLAVFERTKSCVAKKEQGKGFTPSLPQAYFGEAVRDLGIN